MFGLIDESAIYFESKTIGAKLMKTRVLKIEGMTCGHCVMSVKKELGKLAGVSVTGVEIGEATVEVDENIVDDQALARAIADAGYTLSVVG